MAEATFIPNAPVKRADFLMMLFKSLGLTAEPGASFDDVKKTYYFLKAIGITRAINKAILQTEPP